MKKELNIGKLRRVLQKSVNGINVGFIELLSGLNLVAVEADEDITWLALFAVRATTLVPVVTAATAFSRETKVSAALVLGQIAAVGG